MGRLTLTPAAAGAGTQQEAPAPAVPIIEAAHDIVFSESDDIGAVVLHPDGQRALVQLQADAVDLWALAAYSWPEILGMLAAALVLVGLWRVVRSLRRRQQRGAPHCRKCNYNLSGHAVQLQAAASAGAEPEAVRAAAVRCPECGVDLAQRGPAIGRSTPRRVAPGLALVLVVIAAYAGLLLAGGRSTAAGWFTMPSLRAEQMRQDRGLTWMDDFQSDVDVILEVDLASGRTLRQVAVRKHPTYFPPDISPDGRLWTLDGGGSHIDVVETRSGRTVARFSSPGDIGVSGLHRTVRFAPDGEHLYIAVADGERDKLVRWNWKTGEQTVMVDSKAFLWSPGGTARPVIRHYLVLDRPEGLRFLAAPHFAEAYPDIGHYMRIYDEAGAELGHYPVAGASPSAAPVVTPDGRRAFVAGRMQGVHGFDLEEGRPLGWLDVGAPSGDELAISPDGRLLAIPVHGGRIRLRDIEEGRWVGELRFNSNLIGPEPRFSSDGRWLAAVCFDSQTGGGGGSYVHHLLIFDLTAVTERMNGNP